ESVGTAPSECTTRSVLTSWTIKPATPSPTNAMPSANDNHFRVDPLYTTEATADHSASSAISASRIHSILSARGRLAMARSASAPGLTPKAPQPVVDEANACVDTTTTAPAAASATLLMKRWLISDSSSLSRTCVPPHTLPSGHLLGIAA